MAANGRRARTAPHDEAIGGAPPIQRRMRSDVEVDDPTNYQEDAEDGEGGGPVLHVGAVPGTVKAEFDEIVTGAVTAIQQAVPELEELLDLVIDDWMDIDIQLANRAAPGSTAGGQTINGQQIGTAIDLRVDASGMIDVRHLTAPPVKALTIKVYKQGINPQGADVGSRYSIGNHAQIYQVIMHELLMHAVPHMRHMRNRDQLTAEQRIPAINAKSPDAQAAMNASNIPALEASKRAVGIAAKHEDSSLWQKQRDVVLNFVPDGRVSRAEFAIEVINDLFEHIGQNGLNEEVRDDLFGLVQDLLGAPGIGDQIAVIRSVLDKLQFQIEDVERGKDFDNFGKPDHLVAMVEESMTEMRAQLQVALDAERANIYAAYQAYCLQRVADPAAHAERLGLFLDALAELGDSDEYRELRREHEIAATAAGNGADFGDY